MIFASITPHLTVLLASEPSEKMYLFLLALIVSVIAVVAGLAYYGVSLADKRQIVIYESRGDWRITCLSLIAVVGTLFSLQLYKESPWVLCLALIVTLVLVANSLKRAFRANATAWEGLLAALTKYSLPVAYALCALFALGAATTALNEAQKKRYKDAAISAGLAVAGAAGFVAMRKLINRLIPQPLCNDKAPPNELHQH